MPQDFQPGAAASAQNRLVAWNPRICSFRRRYRPLTDTSFITRITALWSRPLPRLHVTVYCLITPEIRYQLRNLFRGIRSAVHVGDVLQRRICRRYCLEKGHFPSSKCFSSHVVRVKLRNCPEHDLDYVRCRVERRRETKPRSSCSMSEVSPIQI